MEAKQVVIRLDPNLIIQPMVRHLGEKQRLLILASEAVGDFSRVELPPLIQEMGWWNVQLAPKDLPLLKEELLIWIIHEGISSMMSAVNACINEASKQLLTLEYARSDTSKSLSDLLTRVNREGKRLLKEEQIKPLEQRLKWLNEHGVVLVNSRFIQSVNEIRNCIEHRSGIVGTRDTKGTNLMNVEWQRMRIFYTKDGNEIELQPGKEYIISDSTIMQGVETVRRSFVLGSKLDISLRDFSDIGFTCWLFALELAQKIESVIKSGSGFPPARE